MKNPEQAREISDAIATAEQRRRQAKVDGDIKGASFQMYVIRTLTETLARYI